MNDTISLSGNAAEEAVGLTPETLQQPRMQTLPVEEKKLGVALVGLGSYSEHELGPALKETAYCRLTAIISGSAAKRERWALQYDLKERNLYSYENFDEIRSNSDIDIVYVVLPNALHAEYAIRAARAGKHVICEKPMATTIEDCHRMIDACRKAGVRLSIGYRLHFDPFNQEMMRLGQNEIYGSISRVIANHGMDVGNKDQWRLDHALAGGGPLMDLGIYCVQGALYTIGELPVAVSAKFQPKTDANKFKSVEEGIEWEMDFPGGIKAVCESGYSKESNLLRAEAADGWFELKPAYEYTGLKGKTSDGPLTLSSINQQSAQMDDFALCIQNKTESRVPGEMGLRDLQILMAIYESARTERTVHLHLEEFQNLIEI